jgi:FAD/FMN-containing dehydrogenase
MTAELRTLAGWGRCPVEECRAFDAESTAQLREALRDNGEKTWIPRGLGRAYGDSALNRDAGVLLQQGLNRFRSFNAATGLLECEAGVSLAEIIEHFLPRGWFVPVTPGTKFVTLGGAIAADVHGKNHHRDGSFGNFIRRFELLIASGEVLSCSPSEHSDIFWATIGGMGLTGCILSAQLQLTKVESAYYDVTYRRTLNLDHTLDVFASTDAEYRYSVAWIDCLSGGKKLGRSVLMLGNDARRDDLPPALRLLPLRTPPKRKKTVPFNFPALALNSWSIRAFNTIYYAAHPDRRTFVDYDTYFYPLDSIGHWNRIYGKRGFVQYQALFPRETSRQGLVELLEAIVASRRGSFLAVLKSSGEAGQGLLSYLYPGHTLALDFPNTGEDLRRLTDQLDEILLKHGGRLYLAKDALMSAKTFAAMYPRLPEFQAIKSRIDPLGKFSSSQARRVGIVEKS